MVSLSDSLENMGASLCMGFVHAAGWIEDKLEIEKKVLVTSRAMHDIYNVQGFEKWSKAILADLRFLSFIPRISGIFDESLKTFEGHKDILYASMFVDTADFFKSDGKGNLRFTIPRYYARPWDPDDRGSVDKAKIILAVGNFFELFKFMQKYQVYAFATCTKLANQYGAVKLFGWKRFDDIPVIMQLFDKPKDICVFVASVIEVYRGTKSVSEYYRGIRDESHIDLWETFFKCAGSTGKMVLIWFGRDYNKFFWFAIADLITQNAGLFGYLYKKARDRSKHFENPIPPVIPVTPPVVVVV